MTWNFDMSAAPKGRMEETTLQINGKPVKRRVFVEDRVIVAGQEKGHRTVSHWIPEIYLGELTGKGRWNMFTENKPPKAWMAFPDWPEGDAELSEPEKP